MDYLKVIRKVPGKIKLEQCFQLSDFVRELSTKNTNRKKRAILKNWGKAKKWDIAT